MAEGLYDESGAYNVVVKSDEATGTTSDAVYDDTTGAEDGTVVSLLKAIYLQLVQIAENTTPTP